MDRKQANRIVVDLVADAKGTLLRTRGHDSVAYVVSEDTVHRIDSGPLMQRVEDAHAIGRPDIASNIKDAFASRLREMCAHTNATGFLRVGEVWLSSSDRPGARRAPGADDPRLAAAVAPNPRYERDRKEGVMIEYEFRLDDGTRLAGVHLIEFARRAGGRIRLIKEERVPGEHAGRYMSMLP